MQHKLYAFTLGSFYYRSKEVERLRAACERFDGDTKKATDFCMPKLPVISVGEYIRALNLFLEQKPMFPSHVDIKQLQKRYDFQPYSRF